MKSLTVSKIIIHNIVYEQYYTPDDSLNENNLFLSSTFFTGFTMVLIIFFSSVNNILIRNHGQIAS